MAGMPVKTFESPDEVRPSEGKGKADVLDVGGRVVGRTPPGARLEVVAQRQADCGDRSTGIAPRLLSVGPDESDQGDGSENVVTAGEVVAIPGGRDAEVVGEEPCVFI